MKSTKQYKIKWIQKFDNYGQGYLNSSFSSKEEAEEYLICHVIYGFDQWWSTERFDYILEETITKVVEYNEYKYIEPVVSGWIKIPSDTIRPKVG